jgi:kynurenine formamidase
MRLTARSLCGADKNHLNQQIICITEARAALETRMTKRWQMRPDGANWGEFGEDDQVGRLHLITPARRLAAAREIREGINFVLSLPLDLPGGKGLSDSRRRPKLYAGMVYNTPVEEVLKALGVADVRPGCVDVGCDDGVDMFLQYSTQWDALSHMGALFDADGDGNPERVYYNGWRGEELIPPENGGPYAKKLGIENMARTGVQGRGVLVDLTRMYGFERKVLTFEHLQRAMDQQNVVVEPGDILCLRTGFAEVMMDMGNDVDRQRLSCTGTALDGGDMALQKFIADSGIVAICADNRAVEATDTGLHASPLAKGYTVYPLHHLCLFKLGIHLGELWYFGDLAQWLREHGRNRFFLTAPPLNLPGAVGSPATPVATV